MGSLREKLTRTSRKNPEENLKERREERSATLAQKGARCEFEGMNVQKDAPLFIALSNLLFPIIIRSPTSMIISNFLFFPLLRLEVSLPIELRTF